MADELSDILKTIDADDLGRALNGIGINILCPDPLSYAPALSHVFDLKTIRLDGFFGLLSWKSIPDMSSLIQIHADSTYASHPYHQFLGDTVMRGVGVELRLFEKNPDAAVARAKQIEDYTIVQYATDKPHGMREAFILDPLGYCWVPSTPL